MKKSKKNLTQVSTYILTLFDRLNNGATERFKNAFDCVEALEEFTDKAETSIDHKKCDWNGFESGLTDGLIFHFKNGTWGILNVIRTDIEEFIEDVLDATEQTEEDECKELITALQCRFGSIFTEHVKESENLYAIEDSDDCETAWEAIKKIEEHWSLVKDGNDVESLMMDYGVEAFPPATNAVMQDEIDEFVKAYLKRWHGCFYKSRHWGNAPVDVPVQKGNGSTNKKKSRKKASK